MAPCARRATAARSTGPSRAVDGGVESGVEAVRLLPFVFLCNRGRHLRVRRDGAVRPEGDGGTSNGPESGR
jgi:hypothetical protein